MSDIPPSNTNFVTQQDPEGVTKLVDMVGGCEVGKFVMNMVNQSEATISKDEIRQKVAEKTELAIMKFLPYAQGNSDYEVRARRLTLQFTNKPSIIIYGGEEIKAEDGANIKLALVDAHSGLVIVSGPEAEAELQIFLLEVKKEDDEGPWTSEMFSNKIVGERAGTKLSGDLQLKLNRGIGIIDKIKFASSSANMKKGLFKLGARVFDSRAGIHIEGRSESFTGKDYRIKYHLKDKIPELSDKVWKLSRIGRKTHKKLEKQGIYSVKDFLFWLNKDPEELKNISDMRPKDWEVAVEHARKCKHDQSIFCIEAEERNGVVQNMQALKMVGECSTMNGHSPSALQSLQVSDYSVDVQATGEHHTLSSSFRQEYMSNICEDPEEPKHISEIWVNDWEVAVEHARTCKHDQTMIFSIEPVEHNDGVQNIQFPWMVGECSTMNGHSPSAVYSLHVSDYSVDLQSTGEHHSSSFRQEYMSLEDFELEKEGILGDNQENQIYKAYAEHQIDFSCAELVRSWPCKSWMVLIIVLTMKRWIRRKRGFWQQIPVPKRLKIA